MQKETLNKVLYHYCDLKGFNIKDIKSRDYGRFYKAINNLLERTEGDPEEVNKALDWLDKKAQDYDWTLETMDKKWLEFKAKKKNRTDLEAVKGDEYLRSIGFNV